MFELLLSLTRALHSTPLFDKFEFNIECAVYDNNINVEQ